ncbi:hypothetical protein HW555_005499 [Spodoptera exigua]|uniref:Luciferase n=1 Tax=Spodoptera exigua TaxID=7107 RepID=A0A835GKG6_SPOEX|nr:hypothetical protein HW555_005499 [Spodoptera exigua]
MKLAPFDLMNENYHAGHLCLDTFRSRPDAVCQIDAATGESETNASVLARSIQLAKCFKKLGVKPGDVLALGGRNHLDLHIPYYSALMTGMPIAGVDPMFKYTELKTLLKIAQPRIAFCQKELLEVHEKIVEELDLNTEVICFDEGRRSLASFIEKYDDKDDQEEFLPTIFDRNKINMWLISTGGTSGVIKLAAFTHTVFLRKLELLGKLFSTNSQHFTERKGENKMGINLSPVQWPISVFMSPIIATALMKSEKKCDFSSFNQVVLSGGKVHKDVHVEIRKRVRPGVPVVEMYGQTENLGPILIACPNGPIGNCGKSGPGVPEVKLVDPETGKEITEPNVPGEMWTKGASMSGYYNNPEETANAFSEDGWYKTGDILYRDEEGHYFFVERLKMLIKYRMYHIIPPEIEAVIREHPGVQEVSVTSVPHEDDGEHVVACVMRRPGSNVTAAEIKEMVADKLSDSQRLRGGVIFMDQIPMTSSGKIARGKLRTLVQTLPRE